MAKRTEDEIQRKLAELEVAMKHEQAIKAAEATADVEILEAPVAKASKDTGNMLSRIDAIIDAKIDAKKAATINKQEQDGISADLYHFGGMASLAVGLMVLMSHITVGMTWGAMWGGGFGLMLLPMFAGIGMLIYNYKSRVAQLLTVASLGLVIFTVISRLTLGFYGSSLLDLIILALPICAGLALLAKANDQRRQAKESPKQIK